jgi:hypothetical protein
MTRPQFQAIYRELITDNPLAVRAVLMILDVEFTDTVETLAVTCEDRPRLKVNLAFITRHCHRDDEVRAVIVHEFLHVLLRHTQQRTPVTEQENIATDAVINAIIHRTMGEAASGFMSRFYAEATGVYRLLRRPTDSERNTIMPWWRLPPTRSRERRLVKLWTALYDGTLVAEDILALADDLTVPKRRMTLLGNHEPGPGGQASGSTALLDDALAQTRRALQSGHVFRTPAPDTRPPVAARVEAISPGERELRRWTRDTARILRRHLQPDAGRASELAGHTARLPVLSPTDRRAAVRSLWSAFIPDATWEMEAQVPLGRAMVYLDASGSMAQELPLVVALLAQMGHLVSRPLWAFSTEVQPARLVGRRLDLTSTGGTSMACVLEHVAKRQPRAAVVITDGFIERIAPRRLRDIGRTRLHVLVTRDGSTDAIERAGLSFTQLGRVPS